MLRRIRRKKSRKRRRHRDQQCLSGNLHGSVEEQKILAALKKQFPEGFTLYRFSVEHDPECQSAVESPEGEDCDCEPEITIEKEES